MPFAKAYWEIGGAGGPAGATGGGGGAEAVTAGGAVRPARGRPQPGSRLAPACWQPLAAAAWPQAAPV